MQKTTQKIDPKNNKEEKKDPKDEEFFKCNEAQLLQLIKFYARDVGLINHQIESFNDLVKKNGGFQDILKNYFHIKQDVYCNEESMFTHIKVDMSFSNVQFEKPHLFVRNQDKACSSVEKQPLTPSMVRKSKGNYEAEMFFDITFIITPHTIQDANGKTLKPKEIKKMAGQINDTKDIVHEATTYNLQKVHISHIPVMVKSILCNLDGRKAIELLNVYEDDPTDPGGYFIVKGHEWVISSTESVLYNFLHIRDMGKKTEIIKGMIICRGEESGFGNSYRCDFRLYGNNMITIEVNATSSYSPVEIPFQIFFRMMGICTDEDIAKYVLYDPQDEGRISNEIWNILSESFDKVSETFKEIRDVRDQHQILEFVGSQLMKKKKEQQKQSVDTFVQNDMLTFELSERLRMFTLDFYNKQYLTQFSGENAIDNKLVYTGLIIRQLIFRRLNITQQTDRDSLRTKRIVPPGVQFAKELKTITATHVIKPIMTRLMETAIQPGFNPAKIDLPGIVNKSIASSEINKILSQSLISGEDKIYSKRKAIPNRITSQEQLRKNNIFTIQSLRIIQTSEGKVGSQNERSAELRQVHTTFTGYICPSQTPDTGRKIGMNKQMAIMASITGTIDSQQLYDIIQKDITIKSLDDLDLKDIIKMRLSKVFINGRPYGYTAEQLFVLRQNYVEKRRQGLIHPKTTIHVDIVNGILYFWTDTGRLYRPLLIAYSDKNGDQYIKITREILNDLTTRKKTFHDLIKLGVMEYISAEEQDNCLISQSISHLYENNVIMKQQEKQYKESSNDLQLGDIFPIKKYTHVEIEQSILGIVVLIDPFANHSQSQRASMLSNQAKQTNGWASLDYPFRYNKIYFMQHVCEMPLVKTITNDIALPGGQNTIVAVMVSDGYNQLDSIVVNRSSIERGLMSCTCYTYELVELEKNEVVQLPDEHTMEIKPNASYSKLDNSGIVKKGLSIVKNDVLVSKKMKINKQGEEGIQWVDNSLIYTKQETFTVDNIVYRDDIDTPFVMIRLKSLRLIEQGDKQSNREGCKGTVGQIIGPWDIPYTSQGVLPDILLNSLSIPNRMIVGTLMEMFLSRKMEVTGQIMDGSSFQKVDILEAIDFLKTKGIDFSEEILYSGKTGERMKAKVYIAPCFSQRLQKFAKEEFYVTSGGPRNATTRQPLEGKSSQGGIKIGEMEKDCLTAHGCMRFLRRKFHEDSDGYMSYVCRNCGCVDIVVNTDKQLYRCNVCKQELDIVKIASTWCNNLLFKEMESMGCGVKLNIKPKEYLI